MSNMYVESIQLSRPLVDVTDRIDREPAFLHGGDMTLDAAVVVVAGYDAVRLNVSLGMSHTPGLETAFQALNDKVIDVVKDILARSVSE